MSEEVYGIINALNKDSPHQQGLYPLKNTPKMFLEGIHFAVIIPNPAENHLAYIFDVQHKKLIGGVSFYPLLFEAPDFAIVKGDKSSNLVSDCCPNQHYELQITTYRGLSGTRIHDVPKLVDNQLCDLIAEGTIDANHKLWNSRRKVYAKSLVIYPKDPPGVTTPMRSGFLNQKECQVLWKTKDNISIGWSKDSLYNWSGQKQSFPELQPKELGPSFRPYIRELPKPLKEALIAIHLTKPALGL